MKRTLLYFAAIALAVLLCTALFAQQTQGNAMVFVEGGTFQMGNANGGDWEKPIHTVTVKSFYMGKYEVTQKEWREVVVVNSSPSQYKGDNLPVENVSWIQAVAYCNLRSIQEGLTQVYRLDKPDSITCNWNANGYRLPTEAEWEYAARGGNKEYRTMDYAGSNSVDAVAWWLNNISSIGTQLVGQKQPNALGLYDMSGNVWEMCWDWFGNYTGTAKTDPRGPTSGTHRVMRGGSWRSVGEEMHLAVRGGFPANEQNRIVGFRVVRNAQ